MVEEQGGGWGGALEQESEVRAGGSWGGWISKAWQVILRTIAFPLH